MWLEFSCIQRYFDRSSKITYMVLITVRDYCSFIADDQDLTNLLNFDAYICKCIKSIRHWSLNCTEKRFWVFLLHIFTFIEVMLHLLSAIDVSESVLLTVKKKCNCLLLIVDWYGEVFPWSRDTNCGLNHVNLLVCFLFKSC